MWGPRLPVAPTRAMEVRGGGVDIFVVVFSVFGSGCGGWARGEGGRAWVWVWVC